MFHFLIENSFQNFYRISDPPTNVCFNSFKENFIGQKLLTRVCMYCDSKGYHYEDMVDLFIPLPNEGNVNENFIKVCQHHF